MHAWNYRTNLEGEKIMGVTVTQFGRTQIGKDIKLYTIKNAKGSEAAATNIGACLVNLVIPNCGKMR